MCPTKTTCNSQIRVNQRSESVSLGREQWNSAQLQAGEETSDQQTVQFVDAASPEKIMADYVSEELADNTAMDAVSLAEFLSRPVKIDSVTWTEAMAPGTLTGFNVWQHFFDDTRIKYKLNNWAYIKCNLKIRVVYNASPFYYGAMMINWRPLPNFNRSFLFDDGTQNRMIPYSQMPMRGMIYPQQEENVEMTLPFFWPANFLKCQLSTDFADMGVLYLNILSQLKSANDVVGQGITLSIYAWAEDVVLSGPSVGLALQAGKIDDEYSDDGPISKPASAIANIAARLGDVPVIGRFATATQIGATAVSHIAKLFGFTNVPVIKDQEGRSIRSFPPIASVDIGYPVEKLTVDAKNELTIDHRSVGLGPLDELPIAQLVQRESYLTTFDWTTAQAEDQLLYVSAVTPSLYAASADTNQYLYLPPMAFVANMFNFWRGDVIVRFRIIASKYHRGRLRFSYDPDGYALGNIAVDAVSSSVVMTKIIDIGETTDIEIRIPYQQFRAWCTTTSVADMTKTGQLFGASGFKHTRGVTNGMFTMRVHNVLTAPVATSTVNVLVFVRGAENLDFASPSTAYLDKLTAATMQAGDLVNYGESGTTAIVPGKIGRPIDHLYLTYMGERIGSLRVLLRRMCRITTYAPADENLTDYVYKRLTFGRLPPPLGYDSSALDTVHGVINPIPVFGWNWTTGNFLNYITPAFIGNRGSVNWSANSDMGGESGPCKHFTVVRDKTNLAIGKASTGAAVGTQSENHRFWFNATYSTGAGGLVSNATAGSAHWQMPFYQPLKFLPCDNNFQNTNTVVRRPGTTGDMWTAQWSQSSTQGVSPHAAKLHLYAGAGTDFDLLYFLHVPTYGVLSSYPIAV